MTGRCYNGTACSSCRMTPRSSPDSAISTVTSSFPLKFATILLIGSKINYGMVLNTPTNQKS